jgi:predicted DNA-binding transcriptional regulator AlpA
MVKDSRKLTVAEYEALAEAWYYRFGELLPTGDASDREPPPPKPQLPPPNYLVAPKVAAKLMGVSLSYLQRAEKDGRLPKRVKISERRVGYFVRDIEAWQQRIEDEARGPRRTH